MKIKPYRLPALLVVVLGLTCTQPALTEDWNQWRGPGGVGVSSETDLPTHWGPEARNVLWRTAVRGRGVSSPIISKGRVFLTTAYRGEKQHALHGLAQSVVTIIGFTSLVWMAIAFGRRRKGASDVTLGTEGRIRWKAVATAAFWIVSISVLVFLTAVILKPNWFWRTLSVHTGGLDAPASAIVENFWAQMKELGFRKRYIYALVVAIIAGIPALLMLGELLRGPRYTDPKNRTLAARWTSATVVVTTALFCLSAVAIAVHPNWMWHPGEPDWAWLVSGGIALVGVGASIGWLPERSLWRLPVVSGGVVALILFLLLTPLNFINKPVPFLLRFSAAALGAGLLGWHAAVLGLSRRKSWPAPATQARGLAPLLVVAAALLFLWCNFLQPRTGTLRVALCVDALTGELVWETPLFLAPEEPKHRLNSYATPTPSADGQRLFVHYGAGTAALDYDGNIVWQVRDTEYHRYTRYGAGSSPVVTDEAVIIMQDSEWMGGEDYDSPTEPDGRRPGYLTALDKETGEPLWRIEPRFAHDSYSTPLLYQRNTRLELITATWNSLVAYNPFTGKILWQHKIPIRQIVPSIVTHRDRLIVAGGYSRLRAMLAIDVTGDSHGPQTRTGWEDRRGVPGVPSPIIYNDLLFTVSDNGIMYCRDPKSGKVHWKARVGGKHYASPVAGDGKVYVTDGDGLTTVLAAARNFVVLAKNQLGEGCYASQAISNGRFYFRTDQHLFCIFKAPASNVKEYSDRTAGAGNLSS